MPRFTRCVEPVRIQRTYSLDLIRRLDKACLPYDEPMPESTLWDSAWWTAEDGYDVIAYAGLYLGVAKEAWLVRAGVLEPYQGHGLQRRLIRVRLRAARRLGLERVSTYTHVSNIASQRNLIACGFRPVRSEGEQLYLSRSA